MQACSHEIPKDRQQGMSKNCWVFVIKNLLKCALLDCSHGQSISGFFLMRPTMMLFIYKFFQSVYFIYSLTFVNFPLCLPSHPKCQLN